MAFFVLAILVAIVAASLFGVGAFTFKRYGGDNIAIDLRKWAIIPAGLAVLLLFLSTLRTVGATEVGVPTQFGHLAAQLGPGWHLTSPFMNVSAYDTRVQNYVMSDHPSAGQVASDNSINVQAQGGGTITIPVQIRWQVVNADRVFRIVGSADLIGQKVIHPDAFSIIPSVAGQFAPEQIVYRASDVLAGPVKAALETDFATKGLKVDGVFFGVPVPQGALANAIDQRNAAQLAAQTATARQQAAKVEAETAVITAQGQANAAKVLGSAIEQFPNLTCNLWVQDLADGKIQGTQYVSPCGGAGSNLGVLVGGKP